MLAYRFAYELSLGLARRRDRRVELLRLRGGKPNEQGADLRRHIPDDMT